MSEPDWIADIRKRCDYGEPDASDVEKLLKHIDELEREINGAKRALMADFVAQLDQNANATLEQLVKHAGDHHGWHHDAADVTYVQGIEIARDAALARAEELEETLADWESGGLDT